MNFIELGQEVKGWQPLIGTLIGFGGLISGALFNAHLNRKRDDRIRDTEAITIALSLYGEILTLRNEVSQIANVLGRWYVNNGPHRAVPSHFREIFPLREPTLYKALAPKIGTLNPEILLPITKFYSDYDAAITFMAKLLSREEQQLSYGVEWVLRPAIDAVRDVESALRRIEQLGRIDQPASAPTLINADRGLELAEEHNPTYE